MACGDGSGREAAPDTRAKPSGAKRRRAGSAPDQVLGNVLHLRSKAVLTALWSVVQPYLNPWSRIVEAPPIPAVGFLIGAGPAADQISRDGLRPIANRRISVALVASLAPRLLWHCMAGDAGWAYLFRRTADVSIWISAAHARTHLGPQGGGGCYKGGGGLPNPPTEIQIPLSPTTHEKRATREPVQGNLRTGDLKSHLPPSTRNQCL